MNWFAHAFCTPAIVPEGRWNLAGGKAAGCRPRNSAVISARPGGTPEALQNLPAPLPECETYLDSIPGAAARRWLALPPAKFRCPSGAVCGDFGAATFSPAQRSSGRGRSFAIRHSPFAIQVSVYPALVPNSHVLANVNGVFNAVYVRGDVVGDTLYYGRGAGQDATASAVLSDLADAALDLKCGTKNRIPPFIPHERDGAVLPMDDVVSRYYVRLTVEDRPGVFAKIAGILAKANIGISSIIQPEGHDGVTVPVILMIHDAPNAAMRKALATVAKLSVVKSAPVMIRVESFE